MIKHAFAPEDPEPYNIMTILPWACLKSRMLLAETPKVGVKHVIL